MSLSFETGRNPKMTRLTMGLISLARVIPDASTCFDGSRQEELVPSAVDYRRAISFDQTVTFARASNGTNHQYGRLQR